MKLLVALTCLLVGCLAQKPHPCMSPPLMSGALTVSTQNEKLWVYARYLYDAIGERTRLFEIGSYENKTFTFDFLLHFREHVIYEIHDQNKTCKKSPLKVDFVPLEIPKDASLLAQAVLGSSSGPGQGLLINTWTFDVPDTGKVLSTVTEFGCIPVSVAAHTKDFGWMLYSYFNNVIGIEDPSLLNPPAFCDSEHTIIEKEPVDFFSLFQRKI